ncbi:ATP-binding protein [Desulfolucanica intricata]|uniref:ATP-binding protein n=1 Tax=Desulfolucanica intricata TaxID=1285191 RepID=UPI00082C195B|nr:ATP-binding protein [Desulfolucanica intricata]
MKYMVDAIKSYILAETRDSSGTFKYILPSYPSKLFLALGKELEEEFNRIRISGRRLRFVYGIACRLGKEWQYHGTDNDKVNFATICQNGWYNSDDNLTNLRNELIKPDEDTLVVVLAGYDHIDDQGSLLDFFHLDQQAVWDLCLKHSFRSWVSTSLQNIVDQDDGAAEIKKITGLFFALYEHGLTDLLNLSTYLENLDFQGVMNGDDAYKHILDNLSTFKLPCMTGLASGRNSKRQISGYITPALEFFNYNKYLKKSARKKAIQQIENFKSSNDAEQIDWGVLGKFESPSALLDALKDYIENRSQSARELLKTADFVFIHDNILNYKISKPTNEKSKQPRKLYGLPLQVFLRSLWITLADFKRDMKARSVLANENLSEITLQSVHFKHDFDAGEEKDDGKGDNELAATFLNQVIGGIDEFLENQIQLELGEDKRLVVFTSRVCPSEENQLLRYTKVKTAEPTLQFQVIISGRDGSSVKRDFMWVLPQNHQCRLLKDLFNLTYDAYQKSTNALPVFAIPYMSEIFKARDEDEMNRLLQTAINKDYEMIDLLKAQGIDKADRVRDLLIHLSLCYQMFLQQFNEFGFFYALEHGYDSLRKAFYSAYEGYLEDSELSTLGPLLMKAFMLVAQENKTSSDWIWNDYLAAAVITPLHPAMLEMILHQYAYLCESFCVYAENALEDSTDKLFVEKRWDQIEDLAKIQYPVFGILKDENRVLDTNVHGFEYLHLVGNCQNESSLITSRLLMEPDDIEEEEISDADLFRETRASQLIKRVLLDYRRMHAYAGDGISIGAYCGKEIQPVIAGIDNYLRSILQDRQERIYSLRLIIFSDSRDDSAVMHWVNAWKERWQAAELSTNKMHYEKCRISISYRVVSRANNADQFIKILGSTGLDVMFFTDFIEQGASRFEKLGGDLYFYDDYRKFPVLEKTCCRVAGGGKENHRERVLSNQRFRMGALHAEVMAHISLGHADPNSKHVVISKSDFQPWIRVINTAHKQSAWVVCIDPSVDEKLLHRLESDGSNAREIIGFGTGVGPHGENNYTISTELFSMTDIKNKVGSQIASIMGHWDQNICGQVAESLVKETVHIAGLSIVKATGPSDYVREFIAYALVRKLLVRETKAYCDEIISLDAYRHWFNDAGDHERPDLLRLRADIIDGYFQIEAQIIECKLAQYSEGYLEHARQQIENGLKQLVHCFRPRTGEKAIGIDDRPDQRYWWMQLHRLIASRGETSRPNYKKTLQALERLSEGFFDITWQAAAVAVWTDHNDDVMHCTPNWDFYLDDQNLQICVASAGKEFILKACLQDAGAEIFCHDSRLSYSFNRNEPKEYGDQEDKDRVSIDLDDETPKKEQAEGAAALPRDERDYDKNEGSDENMDGGEIEQETLGWQDESSDGDDENNKPAEADGLVETCKKPIPERILLGSGVAGSRDIYWEFGHPDLPNRHMLVFGASGAGKTYTIQALLCELGNAGQNSVIVDYTNGFTNKQLEPLVVKMLKPKQHVIRREPLAVNPFRKQCDYIDDLELEEEPSITAQRVSGVFAEVYQLGDQQQSALYNAIRDGVAQEGNNFNLKGLIKRLDNIKQGGGPSAASAASVISKIQPFVDMNPFGEEDINSWEALFNDQYARSHIIQLAGFMKDTSRLITEFALIDLYWYYRARGNKNDPKVIVLDEIQNLDHRLDSPLGQFLTEGRKFGISLILATQTLSNLDKDEKDRLFQASHKLFFKPADTEIKSFAQILSDATGNKVDEWVQRLSSLQRGESYSLGYAYNEVTKKLEVNKCYKIKIKALEERF